MKLPDTIKDEIRERIDIADVVSRYVQLKKTGSNFKGLCPFHQEKTPSFTVTPSKGIFHCFGCGKGGDVFAFVMEMEKMGFMEALKLLAAEAGMDISRYEKTGKDTSSENPVYTANACAMEFFIKQLEHSKKAMEYFTGRNLTPETLKKFRLLSGKRKWR